MSANIPNDIGGVVDFLCSESGRWVNAQRVEASGGMFVWRHLPVPAETKLANNAAFSQNAANY